VKQSTAVVKLVCVTDILIVLLRSCSVNLDSQCTSASDLTSTGTFDLTLECLP